MEIRKSSNENNPLQLKVCGMGTPENILEVASLEPNYLGFIFYEASPRNFTGNIPPLPKKIKKTGVFVDATSEFIQEKIKEFGLEAIQLHGKESVKFCQELKSEISKDKKIELIKVFSIQETFDFERLRAYEGIVDLFLFDTKGKNKGGNGEVFNWEILKGYPSPTPFILSGGIGLEEVQGIKVLLSHFQKMGKINLLYGVDVNSKFETAPAQKDKLPLKKFKNEIFQQPII